MQTANFNNQKGTFVTLHGKTGNKAMTQARLQCNGTLSLTPISWISAYLIDKTKTGMAAFVWRAQAFVPTSVPGVTLTVRYETRALWTKK